MNSLKLVILLLLLTLAQGCSTQKASHDYAAFKQSDPLSILVLPPVNHSYELAAAASIKANVTRPLAEAGYYVFPMVLVEETFKQNGYTIAEEIHQLAPSKLQEVFAADAALFIKIHNYGTSYSVLTSDTIVRLSARLVDLKTGELLWQGQAKASSSEERAQSNDGLAGMLFSAIVNQVLDNAFDVGFDMSKKATNRLLSTNKHDGLLPGPKSPKYHKKPRAQ